MSQMAMVIADRSAVRSYHKPSTDARVLRETKVGSFIEILAELPDHQWCLVASNGNAIGYMQSKYLLVQETPDNDILDDLLMLVTREDLIQLRDLVVSILDRAADFGEEKDRMFNMFFKPLSVGDRGKWVLEASRLLRKAGSSLKETEEFTIGMQSAVKAFQKKNGIDALGIIDKQTWKALKKAAKK